MAEVQRPNLVSELVDLAGLTGQGHQQAPPFFIVGAARSGTTLLRVMLDSHPRISVGPETNVLHHWFQAVSNASTLRLFPYSEEEVLRYPAAALELFLVRYMRERGKERWGEKTPNYTPALGQILMCWPKAQVIHCLRDGRDVVCSMRERWGWSVAAGARRWVERVEGVLWHAQHMQSDRYTEVRYEHLTAEPEQELRRVLSFLGEPWDNAVTNHTEQPHDGVADDVPKAGLAVTTASVGRWRQQMSAVDRLKFRRHAGHLLDRLGYD